MRTVKPPMRNVKPIELPTLEDQLSGYGADLMTDYLERPIDELDALASLLAMAEGVSDSDRRGYDIDTLNAIVIRRIRTLARVCRDRVNIIKGGDEPPPLGLNEY